MICKKTGFSYILWAFYSMIVCVCLAMGSIAVLPGQMNRLAMIGIVCLVFFGLAAFYSLIWFLVNRIGAGRKIPKKAALAAELLAVLSCAVGSLIWQNLSLQSVEQGMLADSAYLADSFVKDNPVFPEVAYGAESLLIHMFRVVFLLVGNHPVAAFFFQIVLQLAGSFFLYRGIRKLYGRIAGVLSFLGMVLLPAVSLWQKSISSGSNVAKALQPFWTVYFLFALGFYLLCGFLQAYRKGSMRCAAGYVGAFALGIYLSLVLYLDFYGVLLVIPGCSLLWYVPAEEKERAGFFKRLLSVVLLLTGVLAGMAGLMGFKSWSSGMSFGETAGNWWNAFATGMGTTSLTGYPYGEKMMVLIFLSVLFWGIFSFIMDTKEDRMSAVFFMFLVTAGLQTMGIGAEVSKLCWLFCILVICASICLGQLLRPMQHVKEKEQEMEQEKEQEKKQEKETGESSMVAEPEENPERQEKKPEIKFLENPLPGPKKHVPKTLDYDLKEEELEEEKLDYDLQVADDDDFDLK